MNVVWQAKKLDEVATLQRGFDLPTQNRSRGQYPLVSSSGISDTHNVRAVQGPGVVTGRSGSIGNVFFIEEDFWPLNTVLYVKNFHGNDPRFIFYLLKHFDLKRFASGAGVPTLNRNFVHDELVSVPPLSEQQRIVGILDEAFDGIATAKANAEKNLQNAKELFASQLQSVFIPRSEGWAERRFEELATFRNGINFTRSSRGDSIKLVGVKDFQSNFWAPLDNLDTVITDGTISDLDLLKENDILFVRSNGNIELIGRCLLVGEVADKITHSGFTIRARLNVSKVIPKYLCNFLKSSRVRREMINSGIGANIKSLNQGTLSKLIIPIPSRNQQQQIVDQLDALDSEIQSLESIYQQKIAALDELKQSLLHQAFSGEL